MAVAAEEESSPPGREAFHEVFLQYFPRLRSYFCASGFSLADAEDLCQTVLWNVYQKWDRYRGEGSLDAWIKSAARNAAIDEWRRRGRADFTELSDVFTDDAPAPDREAGDRQEYERVAEAVRALPVRMRTCFLLSVQQNLSHQEIAERLSLSVGTVKVQVWNARRRLKEIFGGKG